MSQKVPFYYDLVNDPFDKEIKVKFMGDNGGSRAIITVEQVDPRHGEKTGIFGYEVGEDERGTGSRDQA